MRTLHVTYEFPPQSWGGLGTYLADLVRHQRECGDDPDVLYVGPGPIPAGCSGLPAFPGGTLGRYSREEVVAAIGRDRHDLVVCHDWPGVVASQSLWKAGLPLVYTCHLPLAWDIGESDDIPCDVAPELEFAGFAFADLVLTVSQSVQVAVEAQFPFTRGRVRSRLSGTNTSFFTPAGRGPAGHRVLYVGRFVEQKGFDLLPGILAHVRDAVPGVELDVIGVGDLEAAVRTDLDARGLADRVTWQGFSDLDVVRERYRRADVVLMPSRLEPFGLVATEAMAAGVPLVAGATGGLTEIVDDGRTGFLVPPDDVPGFARAIAGLLTDPALARRVAAAARMEAVARFDAADAFDGVRECYAVLVG